MHALRRTSDRVDDALPLEPELALRRVKRRGRGRHWIPLRHRSRRRGLRIVEPPPPRRIPLPCRSRSPGLRTRVAPPPLRRIPLPCPSRSPALPTRSRTTRHGPLALKPVARLPPARIPFPDRHRSRAFWLRQARLDRHSVTTREHRRATTQARPRDDEREQRNGRRGPSDIAPSHPRTHAPRRRARMPARPRALLASTAAWPPSSPSTT